MHFERIADKKRTQFIADSISKCVPRGSCVLDVGCGNGVISKAIAALGYRVTAIDVSEKTIEAARIANAHPLLEYKVMNAAELRNEPQRFSAIICSEVLEHLGHPEALLHSIREMLDDDGILLVTVPNGNGPREMFVTRPVQFLQQKNNILTRSVRMLKAALGYTGKTAQSSADDLLHLQFFSLRALHRLAAHTGFHIDKISPSNFIEQVFPYSILSRKSSTLQHLDCKLAEYLPLSFTSGFMSMWKKAI